jgi:hypothetical protein
MSYKPQPPDAQHAWQFDVARREWYYLDNRGEPVYQNSTPRVVRPPGRQQFQPANALPASNYQVTPGSYGTGGSQPIAIRPAPNAQPNPIAPPKFAQVGSLTGFSQSSQSPGGSRLQSQHPWNGPSAGGASPPARHFGGFVPPVNSPQANHVLLDNTLSSQVTEGQQKVLDKGK